MPILSVIIPAYNEGVNVSTCAQTLIELLAPLDITFELIFVDDGSIDDTWYAIENITTTNHAVKGVKLSKNFGKEGAIMAGLVNAEGQVCGIIDCDLQHPPKTFIEMYHVWANGNVDIVDGVKKSRGKESALYKSLSRLFYFSIESFGGIILQNSSDLKLLDRRVVDILINLPEKQRFFRALSSWVGFTTVNVPFEVEPRLIGHSKFSYVKSFKYAVTNITSFTSAPLQIITIMGIIFFIASVVLGITTLYNWIVFRAVEGFTTVILLLLIIGSMLMIALGVIGIYISKIYEEIKNRPTFIIDKMVYQNKIQ